MLSEQRTKRKWLDSVRDAIREEGLKENGWTVREMLSERNAYKKMVGQCEGCYQRGRLKENGWTV